MRLDHDDLWALSDLGRALRAIALGLCLSLAATAAYADRCTDRGDCVLFEAECWCNVPGGGITAANVCGHPAGFTGAYYSLNGLESAEGCNNEADHFSFAAPCPAVAGVADGGRAAAIMTALGATPQLPGCGDGGDCANDCATNVNGATGTGTSLDCWDNFARWSRNINGFARCTNVEELMMLEGGLAQCTIDLVASSADEDTDGIPDYLDGCAGSAAAAEVDSSGCDQAQFCAAFDVSEKDGKKGCKKADWQNDEPAQKKKERDCQIDKNGRGSADDACIPA